MLSVLLTVLAGVARATKPVSIYERSDPFKGTTIYFTDRVQTKLEGGSFVSMRYVYLNLIAAKPVTLPGVASAINIEANLQEWIFIESRKSLILRADGENI